MPTRQPRSYETLFAGLIEKLRQHGTTCDKRIVGWRTATCRRFYDDHEFVIALLGYGGQTNDEMRRALLLRLLRAQGPSIEPLPAELRAQCAVSPAAVAALYYGLVLCEVTDQPYGDVAVDTTPWRRVEPGIVADVGTLALLACPLACANFRQSDGGAAAGASNGADSLGDLIWCLDAARTLAIGDATRVSQTAAARVGRMEQATFEKHERKTFNDRTEMGCEIGVLYHEGVYFALWRRIDDNAAYVIVGSERYNAEFVSQECKVACERASAAGVADDFAVHTILGPAIHYDRLQASFAHAIVHVASMRVANPRTPDTLRAMFAHLRGTTAGFSAALACVYAALRLLRVEEKPAAFAAFARDVYGASPRTAPDVWERALRTLASARGHQDGYYQVPNACFVCIDPRLRPASVIYSEASFDAEPAGVVASEAEPVLDDASDTRGVFSRIRSRRSRISRMRTRAALSSKRAGKIRGTRM